MGANQASEARICGTRSDWRRRDTAGGWTERDCFAVHLWCPIMISGNIVVFLFVVGVRTRQCYRHFQKMPTYRFIDQSNNHYADQLYGERVIEMHGHPNILLFQISQGNFETIVIYHRLFARNCSYKRRVQTLQPWTNPSTLVTVRDAVYFSLIF
jgi:hypothetical protein